MLSSGFEMLGWLLFNKDWIRICFSVYATQCGELDTKS